MISKITITLKLTSSSSMREDFRRLHSAASVVDRVRTSESVGCTPGDGPYRQLLVITLDEPQAKLRAATLAEEVAGRVLNRAQSSFTVSGQPEYTSV